MINDLLDRRALQKAPATLSDCNHPLYSEIAVLASGFLWYKLPCVSPCSLTLDSSEQPVTFCLSRGIFLLYLSFEVTVFSPRFHYTFPLAMV